MKRTVVRIAALAACVMMLFAMMACADASSSVSQAPSSAPEESSSTPESSSAQASSSEAPSSSESASVSSTAAAGAQSSGELSDDWTSQQVEVNGVVYTYPVSSVQEFLDNGWSCDDALDYSIPSNTTTSSHTFTNDDGHAILLSFVNLSDETKDVMECQVDTLSFSSWTAEKGATVILPGGIQLGSSYDELIAAWGEPTDRIGGDAGDSFLSLEYGDRPYNSYKIDFDVETQTVNSIFVYFNMPDMYA